MSVRKRDVTAAEVDDAVVELLRAKRSGDRPRINHWMEVVAILRSALREQQTESGERSGLVKIVED